MTDLEELIREIWDNEDLALELAYHGTDAARDLLIDHPYSYVRRYVAVAGNDSHRDKLVNDPEWQVRAAAAAHGNREHATALLDAPDERVRRAAMCRLKELGKREHSEGDAA